MSSVIYEDLVIENIKKMYARTPIKEEVFNLEIDSKLLLNFPEAKGIPSVLCYSDEIKE